MKILKGLLAIIINVLLIPIYIFIPIYALIEIIIIKNSSYVRKNKIRLKGFYFLGITRDPIFLIKNVLVKNNINLKILDIKHDIFGEGLILTSDNETMILYLPFKNIYYTDDEYFIQPLSDDNETYKLNFIIEEIKNTNSISLNNLKLLANIDMVFCSEEINLLKNDNRIISFKNNINGIKKILINCI